MVVQAGDALIMPPSAVPLCIHLNMLLLLQMRTTADSEGAVPYYILYCITRSKKAHLDNEGLISALVLL